MRLNLPDHTAHIRALVSQHSNNIAYNLCHYQVSLAVLQFPESTVASKPSD